MYFILGNAKFDEGHIKCSRGPHLARWPQVPHPCLKQTAQLERKSAKTEIYLWSFHRFC